MPLRIKYERLSKIEGNPGNPKAHADTIGGSITRFGFAEAIVVDDRTGLLVAGHGRVEALAEMYAQDPATVPQGVREGKGDWLVPVTHGWRSADDDEAMRFVIAANATTIRGGWDETALVRILTELNEGPGLAGVGYDEGDLSELLKRNVAYDPTPSFAGSDGSHAEPGLDDRLANYRHTEVRSIVLDYPLAEYQRVLDLAPAAREKHNSAGNAELFLALIRAADK